MTRPVLAKLTALAATALLVASLVALAVPAGAAESTPPAAENRVGVVIQDGAAATPKFGCVTVSPGMTGNDVLIAAKHKLTFDKSNFLSQIDGIPATVPKFDDKHPTYWSYWHLGASGTWAFSNEGADKAHPTAATVEGWFYVDGASYAPAAVTFAQVCPEPAKASASTVQAADTKKSANGSKTAVVVAVVVVALLAAAAALRSRRNRAH
jgi:hypothetical protein